VHWDAPSRSESAMRQVKIGKLIAAAALVAASGLAAAHPRAVVVTAVAPYPSYPAPIGYQAYARLPYPVAYPVRVVPPTVIVRPPVMVVGAVPAWPRYHHHHHHMRRHGYGWRAW
jgi:hypothetical protein